MVPKLRLKMDTKKALDTVMVDEITPVYIKVKGPGPVSAGDKMEVVTIGFERVGPWIVQTVKFGRGTL